MSDETMHGMTVSCIGSLNAIFYALHTAIVNA